MKTREEIMNSLYLKIREPLLERLNLKKQQVTENLITQSEQVNQEPKVENT